MSMDFKLEADDSISVGDVCLALRGCGVESLEASESGCRGVFPVSDMAFFYKQEHEEVEMLSEDSQGESWPVYGRMTFRFSAGKYEQGMADLAAFVKGLSLVSRARFILTFQYETTYAVRNADGLTFLSVP